MRVYTVKRPSLKPLLPPAFLEVEPHSSTTVLGFYNIQLTVWSTGILPMTEDHVVDAEKVRAMVSFK